ncbi:MAG: CxxC-x17-CxxC domain-containing protein, partial [Patescibacteria group bacterium]
ALILEEKTDEKGRTLYKTVCDTCEEDIWVPFPPDPEKPAFCKECLKDYQRLRERTRLEEQRMREESAGGASGPQVVARISQEKPLNLSQIRHIGPKRFKDRKKS